MSFCQDTRASLPSHLHHGIVVHHTGNAFDGRFVSGRCRTSEQAGSTDVYQVQVSSRSTEAILQGEAPCTPCKPCPMVACKPVAIGHATGCMCNIRSMHESIMHAVDPCKPT